MVEDRQELPTSHQFDASGSLTCLFERARGGDLAAFSPLWRHFFPRLVSLAERRLAGRRVAGGGAEDAAQAALVSFWKQLQSGDFLDNLHRESLWNLLATFTVRKLGKQIRREAAAKRGGGQVRAEAEFAAEERLEELFGSLPTHELDVQAAEWVESLPADLQELTVLRLLGYSTKEIAVQLDCTQRKVQRKLELVRLRWEQAFS
jgi:DNA-directed RNA polymerase specialized sigma24 family protein